MVGEVVVVGHGPSLNCFKGAQIDAMTVVRVKHWPPPSHYYPEHMGTRCDYLVTKKPQPLEGVTNLLWEDGVGVGDWWAYWLSHEPRNKSRKPSHGLIAVFCAVHLLKPTSVNVIGFDRVFGNLETYKWWPKEGGANTLGCHDWAAERRALDGIGIPIIDLSKVTDA
jgi:hypothetical protein